MVTRKWYSIKLIGLNERARKIIDYYNNDLKLIEYNEYGKPLNRTPSGEQGIFCVSSDGFWHGWFVMDKDVRFEPEYKELMKMLSETEL